MAEQRSVPADRVTIEDGDTLLVQVAGVDYRIQLPDIDAPENVMNPKLQRDVARTGMVAEKLLPLGERAADGVRDLLPSFRPYRLVFDPAVKDKYGRTPGDLLDGQGVSLSLRLVEVGYAVPSRPDKGREATLKAAADTARAGDEGLWGWRPDLMQAWAAPTLQ
jgi:micrococcal nuclease